MPRLLTIKEALEILRISKSKLYDYIHSNQLAIVKLGSRTLIPATALAALIQQLQQESIA